MIENGLDSRLIPAFLAAGWLLVTLGLWGGCGRPWWIWPLSVGTGFLVVGGAYGWALATLSAAAKVAEEPDARDKYGPSAGEPSGPRRVGG